MIEAAGATPVFVNLAAPDWTIGETALRAAITAKTRVIAINSPHNPTGKVISGDELEIVARAAKEHDLIVICDEVYEHLLFDGRRHTPLMTLPGMRERCIRHRLGGQDIFTDRMAHRLCHGAGASPQRRDEGASISSLYLARPSPVRGGGGS